MTLMRVSEVDVWAYRAAGWRFWCGWYYSTSIGRWAWFER